MKNLSLYLLSMLLISACSSEQKQFEEQPDVLVENEATKTKTMNLHDFKVKTLQGVEFDLSLLKGKKVLVVNVASECGLTSQYENLQELYLEHGGDKFEIIAFPANNFGAQEPGSNEEIATFCSANYGVTFPVMSKVSVKDSIVHPVYQFLTLKEQNGVEDVEMVWNFQKFLINEEGNFVKTIHPNVLPTDEEIVNWINE